MYYNNFVCNDPLLSSRAQIEIVIVSKSYLGKICFKFLHEIILLRVLPIRQKSFTRKWFYRYIFFHPQTRSILQSNVQ